MKKLLWRHDDNDMEEMHGKMMEIKKRVKPDFRQRCQKSLSFDITLLLTLGR
jgi:hypothetical protein